MVSEPASHQGCRTKELFLMDSIKGNVRHFFGVLFAWRGFEFCCCSSVSEAFRERLLCTSLMDSKKVTLGTFSVCFLRGVGSNPAAVRVFRNRPPKDLLQSDRRFPMQGHLPR